MNLKNLSDVALLQETKACVVKERAITLLVLQHLREVNRRRLYAQLSYPSLYGYAMKELGYCESSASRRISAMRLLEEIPEIEEKIEIGKLALTSVAKAQTFF